MVKKFHPRPHISWKIFSEFSLSNHVFNIVYRRDWMVMKPGKNQRSKQTCQDLCWKVHDPVQSFVLRSYTMHELLNQHVSIENVNLCKGPRDKTEVPDPLAVEDLISYKSNNRRKLAMLITVSGYVFSIGIYIFENISLCCVISLANCCWRFYWFVLLSTE